MKKQNGITLIALVITIIVLLILAGVSISMVVGNNGVLTQASNAVIANKEAQAKEELPMAWSSATTKYWSDWVNNSTVNKSSYLTKAGLDPYLSNGSLVEDPTYADGVYTVKYQTGGEVYTMQIDAAGNATNLGSTPAVLTPTPTGVTAAQVAAEPTTYYGQTVNYSANGATNWKIFYADSSNIFLISGDYFPKEKVPTETTGMTRSSTLPYQVRWESVPAAQQVTDLVKTSFKCSGWTDYSTNDSAKCISTLLNTNNWTDLVNATYADYAIGSPTLEMFCASWNNLYPTEKLYCNKTNSNGYYVGTTSEPTTHSLDDVTMQAKAGYSNTLYYPRPSTVSSVDSDACYGYWLASPGSYAADKVRFVLCDGYINGNAYNYYFFTYCLRPVIRLKAGTTLIEGTDGYGFNLNAN